MKKHFNIFAVLSFYGTIIFIVLVLLLHFLRKDLYFPEHFVSEYAIGRYSYIQTIAFFSLAIAQLFLFIGLTQYTKTPIFSKFSLGIWCISLFLIAIFPTNLPKELPTIENNIHNLSAFFAFLSLAIAMILWGRDFRKQSDWQNLSKISQIFGSVSLIILFALAISSPSIVGIVQRLLILLDLSWVIVLSMQLRTLVSKVI